MLLFAYSAFSQFTDACGADHIHSRQMEKDPEYAKRIRDFDNKRTARSFERRSPQTSNVYTIPVVVHILHRGEPVGEGTNLTDEEIINHIRYTNERFRKVAGSIGDGSGVDTHIQIALAVRDENGQCTTGINRVDMSGNAAYMNHGMNYGTTNGLSDAGLIAAAHWNSLDYYNIYVVSDFDSGTNPVGGYAYMAAMHGSMGDGMRILASYMKNPYTETLNHELGHAFNLYHTFEGATSSTCPVVVDGCGYGMGDCCSDTPPQKRGDHCYMENGNTCDNNNTDLTYTRNYMAYGDLTCHNFFSVEQSERMEAAITVERASFLHENGNMSLVSPIAPQADFKVASGGVSCGNTVRLLDNTSCTANTLIFNTDIPGTAYSWTISNASNNYTSNHQNPEFNAEPGVYNVTLTVTNPSGTSTVTKPNFLIVTDTPATYCTPLSNPNGFFDLVVSKVEFNTINRTTDGRVGGPYINFMCTDNTILTAGQTYPLTVTTKGNGDDIINFIVNIDFNNNQQIELDEYLYYGISTDEFSHVFTTNITIPENAVKNVLLPMRIWGSGFQQGLSIEQLQCQQNLLIGDVEDYGIYIVDEATASTKDFDMHNLVISPNPATSIFKISNPTPIENVKLYNMLGQLVLSKTVSDTHATINVSSLTSGTYFIVATSRGAILKSKIIKN